MKRLVSLGILFNAALTTLAAYYIAGLSLGVSLILASILVVTGPTVIIPILRQVNLCNRLNKYLKWEAIINDPIGILFTLVIYEYLVYQHLNSELVILYAIPKAIIYSLLCTFLVGYSLKFLFEKTHFPDFLKVPTVLSTILLIFILAKNLQDGSGLLAVTSLGIFFANQKMLVLGELKKFKESISVFSVSLVFILMAASINLDILNRLDYHHYIFIFFVVVLIRVLSIVFSTLASDMKFKEALLIGSFGPRGIVAASIAGIIGTRLQHFNIPDGEMILPIVFAVIFSTVLVHSLAIEPLAKLLGFDTSKGKGFVIVGASKWSIDLAKLLEDYGVPVLITDSNWNRLKLARNYNLKYYYGEIAMSVQEAELALGDYSYLLVSTDSNAYNLYVANTLAEDFGANNIFQIPLDNQVNMITGDKDLKFNTLKEKIHYGWAFKATPITKEFTMKDFYNLDENKDAVNVLTIKADKSISFVSDHKQVNVKEGDLLVSFFDKVN